MTRIYLASLKKKWGDMGWIDVLPPYDDLPLTLSVRELMLILSVGRSMRPMS